MSRFSASDIWFQPKYFESEHLYERFGALVLKRYVPTGGDLAMRLLRRHYPGSRWVTSSLQSLQDFERRTRLNEFIHLIGSAGFTVLIVVKFAMSSHAPFRLIVALALNLILGFWPVVLQRYNRLRLYRAIETRSSLSNRCSCRRQPTRRGAVLDGGVASDTILGGSRATAVDMKNGSRLYCK